MRINKANKTGTDLGKINPDGVMVTVVISKAKQRMIERRIKAIKGIVGNPWGVDQ